MLAAWRLPLLRLLSGTARPRTGILRSTRLALLHLSGPVVSVQSVSQWRQTSKYRSNSFAHALPFFDPKVRRALLPCMHVHDDVGSRGLLLLQACKSSLCSMVRGVDS